MFEIQLEDLCLDRISRSGQCFRMNRLADEYIAQEEQKSPEDTRPRGKGRGMISEGTPDRRKISEQTRQQCIDDGMTTGVFAAAAGSQYIEVKQQGRHFLFSCDQEEFKALWKPYFDLDLDYGAVRSMVDQQDSYLQASMAYGRGIRILKQDLWEVIITFLISQNNNITRIKRSVEALCARYGQQRQGTGLDGRPVLFHSFPPPERIAESGIEGLQGLGLGYRDTYILSMAKRCCDGSWLNQLRQSDYVTAHQTLMEELGIGKKVADCVCLFGLHHVGAFPVDTHVKQILEHHYPQSWPADRYEGVAGILQQYMFYYHLNGDGDRTPAARPSRH